MTSVYDPSTFHKVFSLFIIKREMIPFHSNNLHHINTEIIRPNIESGFYFSFAFLTGKMILDFRLVFGDFRTSDILTSNSIYVVKIVSLILGKINMTKE